VDNGIGFMLKSGVGMQNILTYLQIILGLVLIAVVLVQSQGTGLGKSWGGGGEFYRSRRGVEKVIFRITVASAAMFILVSVWALLVT